MDTISLLKEFEKITDELISLDINRSIEDVITEIEERLSKREIIIEEIKKCDKKSDVKEILERITEKDTQIKAKFSLIKLNISDSIKEVVKEKSLSSVKKKAHRGYMNVSKQNDGYFIDKKK